MENQNSSYSVQIGKTTFIVCVKQSETAKKPIEKMFILQGSSYPYPYSYTFQLQLLTHPYSFQYTF